MRTIRWLATLVVASLALVMSGTAQAKAPDFDLLVFTGTGGTPPPVAGNAVKTIRELAIANNFNIIVTDRPEEFEKNRLQRYEAMLFLNTGATQLGPAHEQAIEDWFHAGGGFMGLGSAIETEPEWGFLTNVLGARAASRTDNALGTIKVADRVHDASKDLPEYWDWTDRWYNFDTNVRGVSHVLMTVVEEPFAKQPDYRVLNAIDGTMGADHPVAWCKDYQGGRSFYTALGSSESSFSDSNFKKHLYGALRWTAGVADPVYSDCGATVLANYQMSFVAAPPNLSEPIGFDVLPDGTGRVIQTDRRGGVRLHDPATNSTTLLAQIPVYTTNEDGMYGPEVDNNFNSNKWVYLYYSPPTVEDVKLSDGSLVTQTTPAGAAPNTAADLSAWDPWVGYFQLSRFKFVEATATEPAHLDLASEQQILRVSNNRGACCHVAGDIDFDSHNNLWMVTGDDTPAGGGNSGGFGPFNGQRTNENQTIGISGATGGTFTLTFDGQTTAPIAFPMVNTEIEAALEALSNIDDVAVSGGGTRTVNFRGVNAETDVAQMTGDGSGLVGTSPTLTLNTTQQGNLYFAPHVDARRGALNTADLRGKLLRVTVKAGDITPAEENAFGGAYTVPAGNLFPVGMARTRPEIYAMGFRNPFRLTLDRDDVAYISDYSPDSQTPSNFRGPAGTGRYQVVDEPANYGWPLCYQPDLPYYKWDFNTSSPLPSAAAPETHECDNPTRGPDNTSHWVANGGPAVEPGLVETPPIKRSEIWYSYRDNQGPPNGPLGTPCFEYYNGSWDNVLPSPCPQLFPELFTGGVGPHGTAPYDYDPANPSPTKFPPYYDGSFIIGEFTQDTMREVKLDSQGRVFKINQALNCGPAPTNPARPFLCDNPMDMEFGPDGSLYLLTYGDGFFNINADAAMERFEYVKGQRAPIAVISATPTSGQDPLVVSFSSAGTNDPDPGDALSYAWDFDGNGTTDSTEENPTHTYTTRGSFVARLTVTDSNGLSSSANTTITVGNTAPTVTIDVPTEGGTFAFGDNIPFTVTVTDPEDGVINCGEVEVTFVLGHDTHGHAEVTVNGCSGVLPTDPTDTAHGGNVWGIVAAEYTDHGGAGGVPALTTVDQVDIRQKRQEVEFVLEQQGTNVSTGSDVGEWPQQRGSLGGNDWIKLNGPFNLTNIDSITFRTSSTGTAGTPRGEVEIRLDDPNTGTIVSTVTILSTGSNSTYDSQTFPLVDPGGLHDIYLAFNSVPGGPGNFFFNLNWTEFGGAGVGVTP